MTTRLALAATTFALAASLALPAAAQVPSVEDLEEPAAPLPPPPPPLPPPAPTAAPAPAPPAAPAVVVPGDRVTVVCAAPPCAAHPAPAPAALPPARLPMTLRRGLNLDANWRKVYKLGLGLDLMGPAYTLGVTAHWNITSLFGVSATFGFIGPQVLTLQARLMPLDNKWTPYVAAGVSFLLNPGFGQGSAETDCVADEYGYGCTGSDGGRVGDDLLFKGRNIVPSLEVGVMVVTYRGFSAQLGVTFYINDKYRDDFDLLTIPWPKVGLSWYF
jgi:hypothetical protein